jgi:hypothetical protein
MEFFARGKSQGSELFLAAEHREVKQRSFFCSTGLMMVGEFY